MKVLQDTKEVLMAIIEVTTDSKPKDTSESDEDTQSQENSNNQATRVLGSLKRKLEGI